MKFFLLILRNIGRNKLRSALTAVVTVVLVFVVTLVWSILALLDAVTTEKSQNFRAMVTERWSIPSRLPFSYADGIGRGAARHPGDVVPQDWMTWQFYGGTLDPAKVTRESIVFAIACDPKKILTMMEGLDSLPPDQEVELRENVAKLGATRQGVILGRNHLKFNNKRVGDRMKLFGIGNFKGINLEFDIVGAFPPGRYDTLAAFNRDYFNNELDAYAARNQGRKHPLAERSLNIVLLKVPSTEAFNRVAAQIETSPLFTSPTVKCETFSSGIASMLEGFRDLIWGMRWLLAPACLTTILLVIANAISINVRERRQEMAVLKVLGFRPYQLLILVLGESLLLGAGSGFLSAAGAYVVINWGMEGIKFPIAFFDRFMIPGAALWWGPAVGAIAAFAGSFLPAWSARNVKVAEVFAKVA
jgi:putative ABC transport system permease protein